MKEPHFDVLNEYRFDQTDLRVLLMDLELHRELYLERVFPVFENMEEEAKNAADKVLHEWPGDPEDFEVAMDVSHDRYINRGIELYEMHNIAIQNGFVALFHFLEKWAAHHLELNRINHPSHNASSCNINCSIRAFRVKNETKTLGMDLEALRLIANCSKHPPGRSCRKLSRLCPDAFHETFQKQFRYFAPSPDMMNLTPECFETTLKRIGEGFTQLMERKVAQRQ